MRSRFVTLGILLTAFAACGGGDGGGTSGGPASIGTLAYVVTECRVNTDDPTFRSRLEVRQGDAEPITVREIPATLETEEISVLRGLCPIFGAVRYGTNSVVGSAFQRLGVSPDGSRVVFEVTDDFSLLSQNQVAPDHEGIHVVRSDGSGLQRLGPASREPTFRFSDTETCALSNSTQAPVFHFSPSGRRIAYVDHGPDHAGEDAVQIVTLNLDTGERTQVTHLPPQTPDPCLPYLLAGPPVFLDEETIGYATAAGPAGSVAYTVKADGQTEPVLLPPAVPLPGAVVVPGFSITGSTQAVYTLRVAGTPGTPDEVDELFLSDGENLLQLTNFGRGDTAIEGGVLSRNRRRVLFTASDNTQPRSPLSPYASNPYNNCQFFSVDTLGGDLRQLTNFDEGQPSEGGCSSLQPRPFGCVVGIVGHDPDTDSIVFESSCDPCGDNPNGEQIFTMQFDGGSRRQLTHARGLVTEADGTVSVQLPGPFAYGGGGAVLGPSDGPCAAAAGPG